MKTRKITQPFSRLSAAQKRIAIAKDVLKQIKAEQYNIQKGQWLSFSVPEELDFKNMDAGGIVKLFKASGPQSPTQTMLTGGRLSVVVEAQPAMCTCCAVGAACASAIRLFNGHELEGQELGGLEEGKEILGKYFPKAQVDLMEAAFERRVDDSMHEDATDKDLAAAEVFGRKYNYDEARAEAIFNNIVMNGGTFKP
jgi:hypothetical protein